MTAQLTDEQLGQIAAESSGYGGDDFISYGRAIIAADRALREQAQPAHTDFPPPCPVSDATNVVTTNYATGWNACRAAMISATPPAQPDSVDWPKVCSYAGGASEGGLYSTVTLEIDGHLIQYAPQAQPERKPMDNDCTPNHLCNGSMVHLPSGEQCDKCGKDKS